MCLGDFGTDIEAQAETFAAAANLPAEERLEQSFKGRRLNGLSRVDHGQLELTLFGPRPHLNGRSRRPIDKGVTKKIREKLPDPLGITFDRLKEFDIDRNIALRVNLPKFFYDLLEHGFQRLFTIPRDDKPATQSAACKVQNVLDQLGHSGNAAIYVPGDLGRSFGTTQQSVSSSGDRGERIS
jgi:hypothetical protein